MDKQQKDEDGHKPVKRKRALGKFKKTDPKTRVAESFCLCHVISLFTLRIGTFAKPYDHLCLRLRLPLPLQTNPQPQTKKNVCKKNLDQSPSLNQKLVDKGNLGALGMYVYNCV
jgi:hypothetical protein